LSNSTLTLEKAQGRLNGTRRRIAHDQSDQRAKNPVRENEGEDLDDQAGDQGELRDEIEEPLGEDS